MAGMIDPALFDSLKSQMDEDIQVRDELSHIIQSFEREIAYAQGVLSRVHSTPRTQCEMVLIPNDRFLKLTSARSCVLAVRGGCRRRRDQERRQAR